jgi:uncharacterized protein YdaU (DUF1376 family)
MSTPPWMPLDIDAYLADTGHLSVVEHGAYMLLIMRYWKDGGLPDDEERVRVFSRLSPSQWADSRSNLAAFFDGNWHHKRIDAELVKASEIIAKRKSAGQQRHSKSSACAEQVLTPIPIPLPEPKQEEDTPQAQQPWASRGRAELDRLESDLREAAGAQADPSPGLFVLAPILGLLEAGCDLQSDVLPTVRALAKRAKRRPSTWDYYTDAIREANARRRGVAAGGLSPPIAAKGGNIFDQAAAGLRNGSVRNSSGDGAVIDAVPRLSDRCGPDERNDAQGLRDRDRRLLVGGAH